MTHEARTYRLSEHENDRIFRQDIAPSELATRQLAVSPWGETC